MEVKDKLPDGWKWTKLGDVADYLNGRAFKPTEWKDSGKPIIRIQNLNKPTANYNYTREEFEAKYKVVKGDLLFAWSASLGTYIWHGDEAWLNQHIFKVVPKETTDKKYLFYLLEKTVAELYAKAHGSGMVHVTKGKFESTLVPFPSKIVQQSIVSKIEELFSEIDKGIETLRTAQQQLKVYRQAVLKWAFEGKLTNEDVKDSELPEGWTIVSITDLADKAKHSIKAGPFGSALKKEFYTEKGYKIYGQEQVISGDPFYGDYYVNKEKYEELSSCRIKPQDILISLVGTVGKVLLLPENCEEGIINPRLIKISLNKKIYLPIFFKYYFESSAVKAFYSGETRGTTMDVLNLGIIKTIPFPFCAIKEQEKIILEIESRLSVADKMEEDILQSLQQAEALKQSILKQAFEGKLTPIAKAAAKQIPLPRPVIEDPYSRKVFAAYIISCCYNGKHFGKVVFQKILHLAEYHCQCDYEMMYRQKAAGPLDEFINRFIEEAEEKRWFTTHLKNKQVRFDPGTDLPQLLLDYQEMFVAENAAMQQVLELTKNETLAGAELYSTVYAVWNNCLINDVTPTKDRIVKGVYNWSDRKETFSEVQIWDAKGVLEKKRLMPVGFGKEI